MKNPKRRNLCLSAHIYNCICKKIAYSMPKRTIYWCIIRALATVKSVNKSKLYHYHEENILVMDMIEEWERYRVGELKLW